MPALVVGVVAGCARNPVTGRPDFVLVSRSQEQALGAQAAEKVAATIGLVTDPELVGYVGAIGARMAADAPGGGTYQFHVADMVEPNAFALPGGFVYVSRGLLALANSEDELAGVIGHEIGHVAARHAVQRISAAAPLGILTGIGATATGIVSPTLGGMVAGVGGTANQLVTNPYSRQQERQADEIGQELAAKGGWDPEGLPDFLHALERDEELRSGTVRSNNFFASHPSTPERYADGKKRAATLTSAARAPIALDRNDLLARLDGLVLGEDPSGGVVREQRFLHPDLDFTLVFTDGWKIVNLPHAVQAAPTDRRASMLLVLYGQGRDPMAAAAHFAEEAQVEYDEGPTALRVGELAAVRAVTRLHGRGGRVTMALTWIAHAGNVFLLIGTCAPQDEDAHLRQFAATAERFRPLTARERNSIDVLRLRIVTAEPGETPAALVARTGSIWNSKAVAVANALDQRAPMSGGQRIKIARRERYRG